MLQARYKPVAFLLHIVFFLSGCAALGFQLTWTRVFAIGIGHELGSVLAIISAFFGGLTLGAWLLDKPIARSRNPGYWYAALEGLIGLWGLLTLIAIPFANRVIFRWTGLESPDLWRWSLCFLVPFLTLLPATFCMGATLPAMERTVASLTAAHRPVPGLYSANTLGAVFGILAAVFVLSPRLGFRATILLFTGVALACSLSAFALSRRMRAAGTASADAVINPMRSGGTPAILFFTGLLGIGYEIVCTRALSQVFEDSVYTYASLLMVYLLGTSAGAFGYKKWFSRPVPGKPLPFLLSALAFACLAGAALIPAAGPVNEAIGTGFGQGRAAQFAGEMAAAAVVFFLPTVCMGATFSHLAQEAKEKSLGLGRALAVNTLGGALAPFLFGIVLMPALGLRASFLALGLGYCACIRPYKAMAYALAAVLVPLLAAAFVPWNLLTLPPGSRLLEYREGAMASVAALEAENGGRMLKVDNRFCMGGTHSEATERLKTHLPLLLHSRPEKALFIGLGAGITFGTVVDYKAVSADGVELDPLIPGMFPHFSPQNRYPFGGNHRIFVADARRFVRATPDAYDMILADFFHPYRDGAATLYTLEHFRAIRSRLKPGGLFCQWLPLYQLDMLSLKIIIRTFLEVFPHAQGYLGNFSAELPGLALMGSAEKRSYPSGWFAARVGDSALSETLAREAVSDGFKIASFYFASQKDLESLAEDAPLNTDNHPRVMYINPGFSGLKDFTSHGRLEALLDVWKHEPGDFAGPGNGAEAGSYRDSLGLVLAARDLYLRGAIADAEGKGSEALALYLRSAEKTAFFSVGYAKCLVIALDQRERNPEWSKGLLRKLAEIRPEFEDARTVLRDVFGE